jgi:hypothetical protein
VDRLWLPGLQLQSLKALIFSAPLFESRQSVKHQAETPTSQVL